MAKFKAFNYIALLYCQESVAQNDEANWPSESVVETNGPERVPYSMDTL